MSGHGPLALAITLGLVIGKPLGFIFASMFAVGLGFAVKPKSYSWLQLCGASTLAGIGFTMSLFIASQAFSLQSDFEAAKIAVFVASVLSAIIGIIILFNNKKQS